MFNIDDNVEEHDNVENDKFYPTDSTGLELESDDSSFDEDENV